MKENFNQETGLFRKRFTHQQVFDCQRDPLFPKKDQFFTASALTAPYNTITREQISENELENKIFYFEGLKGDNDTIEKLSLWISDDVNKTNPKCISENGSILGLSPDDFLYESDVRIGPEILNTGYGYYVTVTKEFKYTAGAKQSWRPAIEKVTKFTVLEKYHFKEK